MFAGVYANFRALGEAAYDAALEQGSAEEAAAAIAQAVVDVCEDDEGCLSGGGLSPVKTISLN